jgi:hypothetical protein
MRNLASAPAFVFLATVGACTASDPKPAVPPAVPAVIAAVRAESATAAAVAARPSSALWDVDRVSERLVRSGVAPRRMDPPPKAPAFFATATTTGAFAVGRSGELRVFVFRDSLARKRVTDGLDPATASPRGAAVAWAQAPVLIVVQNLAAVMLGGSATLQERVQLALEAGLSAR